MALDALDRFLETASDRLSWAEVVQNSWGPGAPPNGHSDVVAAYHPELTTEQLLRCYRTMITSRRVDERELMLQRQGQAFFSASCAGKEACLIAAGLVLRPTDPLWGYYRDRALVLMRGYTPREMLMQSVAAAADPASGGRQMPEHWGSPERAIVPYMSPVGAQCIPAAGLAEALAATGKLIGQG
ncbi:MAG TPA: thiamine pyrophosphate-dependent enzyme, partial [Planctomycetota bacterium]|nr:thiamine pyrophosphate-dependent enzyme [Planctomycetota bacterium]